MIRADKVIVRKYADRWFVFVPGSSNPHKVATWPEAQGIVRTYLSIADFASMLDGLVGVRS